MLAWKKIGLVIDKRSLGLISIYDINKALLPMTYVIFFIHIRLVWFVLRFSRENFN